eukprot:6193589-Pleurochrysis_carterae.AAC.1
MIVIRMWILIDTSSVSSNLAFIQHISSSQNEGPITKERSIDLVFTYLAPLWYGTEMGYIVKRISPHSLDRVSLVKISSS